MPISETALAALQSHHWPGNLRELHNALRYAAALADQQIDTAHLPDALQATTAMAADSATPQPAPAASLEQVLAQCNGNVSEAARLLGVNRSTIHRRIQRQQLSRSFSKSG